MSLPVPRPGLTLRPAQPADAPALAAIYNESVLARAITFDLDPKPPQYFTDLLAGLQDGEELLVLEDSGEAEPQLPNPRPSLLGFGRIFRYSDRLGYRTTAETSVYVLKAVQRKGYGSLLKQALLDRARALGYHHLVAKVTTNNTASIEYNRRFGYTDVGVQREVGWVDGAWRDVLIMQLVLG